MEKLPGPGLGSDDEQMELPPGFRFHPTDEELITHYLSPKVIDRGFTARAIGEVDLNKVEPWDLPWKAKMGEREWYFFCMRDRKYPTGLRTNRATDAGYWKATGKDKEIHKDRTIIGMKKTLVFYRGRAPKGEKTNWVMHEYRLEGKHSLYNLNKTSSKNEWVICRIFRKSSGGKKTHISGLVRMDLQRGSNLPPLMDCSDQTRSTGPNLEPDPSHVTCFSEGKKPTSEDMFGTLNNSVLAASSSLFPKHSVSDPLFPSQFVPNTANFPYPEPGLIQDESVLRFLLHNNAPNLKWVGSNHEMGRRSYEDQEGPIASAGPVDLDCLWTY